MARERIKLKPYTLVIRTTERCNVGCSHCSISATPRGRDLPVQLASDAIGEAKKYGLNRIHFTGGEPLLYEHLEVLIGLAQELGMSTDITSSTFTRAGETTTGRLPRLKEKGLECVMLSYDDPHSKKVDLKQFALFVKKSLDLKMHVCVFVTEGGDTIFKTEDLKRELEFEQVDVDRIEWTVSEYQFEGRGKKNLNLAEKSEPSLENYCRCPYVMAVPTLDPDGAVLLCHMARFRARNFTVGKYPDESLEKILDRMENEPIYRYLSKHGPQQSLKNLGYDPSEIPPDMCRACEKYLTVSETAQCQEKLDQLLVNEDLDAIEVDIEAVLPIYQRYLRDHGEKL